MSAHLIACPVCRRHVRATDEVCVFCDHRLPASLRDAPPPTLPKKRLGRAALFAFGAALASASCSGDDTTPARDAGTVRDAGGGADAGDGRSDAGPGDSDAGPDDAGSEPIDSGDAEDAGEDSGGIVPPYGTPAP